MRSSETISTWPGRATLAAASAAKRRSAAPARGIPGRPDGRERPLERRLEPAVEPLHPGGLEEHRPGLGRLDREARRPRAAAGPLPRPARRWPGPDRRARARGRSRAPRRAASRPDPLRLRGRGDRAEQRLSPGKRRERCRLGLERRPQAQRRPQVEGRDDEARRSRNVCSIRTHVLLSRRELSEEPSSKTAGEESPAGMCGAPAAQPSDDM